MNSIICMIDCLFSVYCRIGHLTEVTIAKHCLFRNCVVFLVALTSLNYSSSNTKPRGHQI